MTQLKTFSNLTKTFLLISILQNRRAKWRRQEKSESLRLGLSHFSQLPHRLGCNGSMNMPVDPWLSPPLLTALPGTINKHFYRQFFSNSFPEFEGFLSHPQTVYPSYLTPPLSLNPSNINMSQLMQHPNGALRISPQNIPPPSHMPQAAIPTSSATIMAPQQSSSMSPSGSMQSLRSPSPDKKNLSEIRVDSPVDERLKDGNALNMTISPNPTVTAVATDIRTNSIAALRIKAKEHLENINKNLTMV